VAVAEAVAGGCPQTGGGARRHRRTPGEHQLVKTSTRTARAPAPLPPRPGAAIPLLCGEELRKIESMSSALRKIAVCQMCSGSDIGANVEAAAKMVREARRKGAVMVRKMTS
jgi:hypothetical protein